MGSVTDDYVSLVLGQPGLSLMTVISLFVLGLLRIIPIVALAPFLGSRVPGPAKVGLATTVVILLLPFLALQTHTEITFDFFFVLCSLKEIFIGMLLGLLVSVPFWIAQSSGTLIDFQRGSSALMVQDPTTQSQVSPLGLLYNYVLIVIFYEVGGPFIVFDGLLESYRAIPVNQFIPGSFFNLKDPVWQALLHLLTTVFSVAIQMAAPSLLAILMTEMFLGIANRLAQQVQIAFLGMSLKSLVGLGMLYLSWALIQKQMTMETLRWIQQVLRWIPHSPI